MKATVVSIESGQKYTDKSRRIELKFLEADDMFSTINLKESSLGIAGLKLDDVLDVSIIPERALDEFKRQLDEHPSAQASKQEGCAL